MPVPPSFPAPVVLRGSRADDFPGPAALVPAGSPCAVSGAGAVLHRVRVLLDDVS
ncbi:hypothetical protein [Streptomyces naphthomycinicus]|uniref:hypothetical protein n=1 Tax=Streptomyces naphthomycinicus TaxID=2872625 RepID=UPI001CECA7B8|nr:hypothetical protein [Streptomyces sp. TML10]